MDFKDAENVLKPIALWPWNEKLNTEDTTLYADKIINCGFGGFCISARCGLQSKYMGDEWLRNVSAAINRADSRSAKVWLCDDNGNCSGSANGAINSAGLQYQQKFLRYESGEKSNDRTIIFKDGYHFYYDVNPYYVDVFDKAVSEQFIKQAYIPYIERFSGGIDVFLRSNPQFFSENIPWSFTLPAEYKNAYGEELLDVLPELFRPVGNYINTRIKFRTLISKLFSENFLKPVYDYCTANNVSLAVNFSPNNMPDSLSFVTSMASYEYSHIPCIESISKNDSCAIPALAAASAAQQLEKKDSFAILLSNSGYSATLNDFKRIAQQHLARGITGIISACANTSLRGGRKYENASLSLFNCSDAEGCTELNNYISRISSILTGGSADFETLVIYNSAHYWTKFDSVDNDGISAVSEPLCTAIEALEKKHIPFHIADELILQKYACVSGDSFVIGNHRYKTVVLTESSVFLESTTRLLSEFECAGGFITMAESLPSNEICDNEKLLYTYRRFPEHTIHYFVNNSSEEFTASITAADKMIDISTGDVIPFYGIYKFNPYESILLIDDGTSQQSRPFKKPLKTLDLSGEWKLCGNCDNVIVLDKCNVYFDGVLSYENENCADVIEHATALKRPVQIECIYNLNITAAAEQIYLAMENPDSFSVSINDVVIDKEYDGFFINKSLSRINISDYIIAGENQISLKAFFSPSDEFLTTYEKALESSSELNRLNYGLETSPIYILGDFSVKCTGEFRKLDKNAFRYLGDFSLDKKREFYSLSHLEQQGLVFFAGEITFSKTINLSDTSYCIKFNPKGINSVAVKINGRKVRTLLWHPYECDISDFLQKGDNEITLTICTTLRNLLGPHHIPMGELHEVYAGDFFKAPCVWNNNKPTPWESNYCFIEFGIDTLE